MIFGPCQGTSYTAITLNPESNFTRRENDSSPIPLKYIDVSRTTHTNLDVKQERRIDDYWNVDWQRNTSRRIYVLRFWRLIEKARLISQARTVGRKWERNAKLKERPKWSHEKPTTR